MHIERYNRERLDFLKQLLINSVETGKPQDYEIRVDDMRVVPRTNNPELFENYEDFITEQTRRVLVMLYEGVSRKNTKYLFHLKEEDMPKAEQKGLSGKAEVEKIVSEKLEQQAQKWKQEQMEKELKELKEEQKQNEKDFEKIIAHNKKLEGERSLEDMQWGKIIGIAGDTLLKSNTKFLAKIPGMSGLAGIIEADNKEREKQITSPSPEPEVEASFTMKSEKNENEKKEESEKKENPSKNSETSEEERDRLGLLRQLSERFEEKQVKQIVSLLNLFVGNPKEIEQTLKDALQRKAQSSEAKSETKQQAPTESQQQKKKTEQNQENSSPHKNSEHPSEIKPEHLENATEQTTLQGIENQNKENASDEIPNSM